VTTPSDPNQPEGLPSYPSAPPPGDHGNPQQPQASRPPRELVISFWCYLAAAIIALIDGLLYVGAKQAILNTLRANTKGLTESQLQNAANTAVVLFVVIPVIVAGLYVLFAYKLRAVRSWARTALTIVVVVHLLIVVFVLGGTPVSYIGVLAAIVGCVLSYLPNSKAYLVSQRQLR
jgi:heme/copper-type cytochrome/quinol oxidase subunit 2